MKKILLPILLIILNSLAFSQTTSDKNRKIEFDICSPEITEVGRQSSFRFGYRYRVLTDENGLVKDVKEILDHKKYRTLMNDESVIPCIKRWKLKSSETYYILISVGTTGGDNFLDISSKTIKIKILL